MVIITMGSGDTSDFRPDFPMYIAKIAKYKANRRGIGKGNSGNYKGKKGEKTGRIKVRARCKCKVFRCREGGPRNTAISTDQAATVSGENRANLSNREV